MSARGTTRPHVLPPQVAPGWPGSSEIINLCTAWAPVGAPHAASGACPSFVTRERPDSSSSTMRYYFAWGGIQPPPEGECNGALALGSQAPPAVKMHAAHACGCSSQPTPGRLPALQPTACATTCLPAPGRCRARPVPSTRSRAPCRRQTAHWPSARRSKTRAGGRGGCARSSPPGAAGACTCNCPPLFSLLPHLLPPACPAPTLQAARGGVRRGAAGPGVLC